MIKHPLSHLRAHISALSPPSCPIPGGPVSFPFPSRSACRPCPAGWHSGHSHWRGWRPAKELRFVITERATMNGSGQPFSLKREIKGPIVFILMCILMCMLMCMQFIKRENVVTNSGDILSLTFPMSIHITVTSVFT